MDPMRAAKHGLRDPAAGRSIIVPTGGSDVLAVQRRREKDRSQVWLCGTSLTHVGLVRTNNEDETYVGTLPGAGLVTRAIVADGMGGSDFGEVASSVAVESAQRYMRENATQDPAERMRLAIVAGHVAVRVACSTMRGCRSMGTTIVALDLASPDHVVIGNVGDSRCYRMRGDDLEQISRDDQDRFQPNILTQALGQPGDVSPHVVLRSMAPGDVFLLCSDGLTGPVANASIAEVLRSGSDPADMARRLVTLALAAGGPDNVTVVVLRGRGHEALDRIACR